MGKPVTQDGAYHDDGGCGSLFNAGTKDDHVSGTRNASALNVSRSGSFNTEARSARLAAVSIRKLFANLGG